MTQTSGLRPLLWEIGAPIALYYLLRAVGWEPTWCFLAGAAAGACVVAVKAIQTRMVDGIAVFVMATFGLQLVVSLVTGDLGTVLLADSVTSALAGVVFIGSVVAGRPAFQAIALRIGASTAAEQAAIERRWADVAGYRRLLTTLMLVSGITLIVEASLRVSLIYVLGPDAMVIGSRVLQVATVAALVVWTTRYARRSALAWA